MEMLLMSEVRTLAQRVEKRNLLSQSLVNLNSIVMKLVAFIAVVLLCAESIILFVGVISRYVFHSPIFWSDEAATLIFIWLTMFGAVLALDRNEHMRLTAIVSKLSDSKKALFETYSMLIVLLFLACILVPSYEHVIEQMFITSPALEIPDGYRTLAIFTGVVLMMISAMARLSKIATTRQLLLCLLFITAVGSVFWWLTPVWQAMGNYNLLVFFVLLIGFSVLGGVPIAFSFGIGTLSYILSVTDSPLMIVVGRLDEGVSHAVLLAIPLFVFLGALLQISGMAKNMINFMASLLGHVRGGLQFVLLGAMFLVSGISGSKVADMAAVAPALFPEMKKRGENPEELAALLSSTGAMTETIPPSLVLITIGAVCGVSISALFIGGVLPAVVCTLAIAFMCWLRARKTDTSNIQKQSAKVIGKTLLIALPALLLPFLIRACVVEGVATATEVATIGIFYIILIGLIAHLFQRQIEFKRIYGMLVEAVSLSGAILLIIGMATAMAWALTQSGFAATLIEIMTNIPGGTVGFLLVSIVMFILLGSLLEGIPAIVLFGPLLFPAAHALGINDVHYSMVVILAMGLGLFAPPLGVGFYAACAISKVSPDGVFNKVWGYLLVLLLMLLVIAFVPWISTVFL